MAGTASDDPTAHANLIGRHFIDGSNVFTVHSVAMVTDEAHGVHNKLVAYYHKIGADFGVNYSRKVG